MSVAACSIGWAARGAAAEGAALGGVTDGATGGACVAVCAGFVAAPPGGVVGVAAVVSEAGGGADLDEKIRGVKTMTSAIKAAASTVRLSMQRSGKSKRYGTGS